MQLKFNEATMIQFLTYDLNNIAYLRSMTLAPFGTCYKYHKPHVVAFLNFQNTKVMF